MTTAAPSSGIKREWTSRAHKPRAINAISIAAMNALVLAANRRTRPHVAMRSAAPPCASSTPSAAASRGINSALRKRRSAPHATARMAHALNHHAELQKHKAAAFHTATRTAATKHAVTKSAPSTTTAARSNGTTPAPHSRAMCAMSAAAASVVAQREPAVATTRTSPPSAPTAHAASSFAALTPPAAAMPGTTSASKQRSSSVMETKSEVERLSRLLSPHQLLTALERVRFHAWRKTRPSQNC